MVHLHKDDSSTHASQVVVLLVGWPSAVSLSLPSVLNIEPCGPCFACQDISRKSIHSEGNYAYFIRDCGNTWAKQTVMVIMCCVRAKLQGNITENGVKCMASPVFVLDVTFISCPQAKETNGLSLFTSCISNLYWLSCIESGDDS